MQLNELNPHIRYARGQSTSLSNKPFTHICYDARLFYFQNATGTVKIGKEIYNLSNNTAIYLPPLTKYSFDVKFGVDTHVYTFDFDLTTEYSHITHSLGTANLQNFDPTKSPSYEIAAELSKPIIREIREIKAQLTQTVDAFADKKPLYRERASAMLKLCLLELVYRSREIYRSELCERILASVHKNYTEPTLTNADIAKELNYHPYHVNRIVKKEVGIPLRSYIIFYRLGAAKNLLLTTQSSISEIAEETGFSSTAYFIKVFKEKNGMTPKEYRRQRIHTEI